MITRKIYMEKIINIGTVNVILKNGVVLVIVEEKNEIDDIKVR